MDNIKIQSDFSTVLCLEVGVDLVNQIRLCRSDEATQNLMIPLLVCFVARMQTVRPSKFHRHKWKRNYSGLNRLFVF